MRFILLFLTLTMSLAINMDEGILSRLGIDANFLFIALIAVIITGLVAHRYLAMIVLIILMAIGANVPVETALGIGYDPDYLLAGLAGLIFAPYIGDQLGIELFMS